MATPLNPPKLKLDWCSHTAAKYAVERWHYSRAMPVGQVAKIGVWEDGQFVGTVLFTKGGARSTDGRGYGLPRINQVAELQRVALTAHVTPVSRILKVAVSMVKRQSPKLRLLVSYADPEQGHAGIIYQASNWVYVGRIPPTRMYRDNVTGKVVHSRSVTKTGLARRHGVLLPCRVADNMTLFLVEGKYKYLYPLDAEMRSRIESLRQPYPKRV